MVEGVLDDAYSCRPWAPDDGKKELMSVSNSPFVRRNKYSGSRLGD